MMTPAQIKAHQRKLLREGFNPGPVDGIWGSRTEAANAAWEKAKGTLLERDDGGDVRVPRGGAVAADTNPRNAMHPPLSSHERATTFGGPFQWIHAPQPGNRENIRILNNWESANIVTVEVPQLRRVPGNFSRMRLNKRVADQTVRLWAAWEEAGLLGKILSYEGAYVPRLIRGSTTSLSNHAYGSAFDINYYWNQLNRPPARTGATGSVRELVPLAHQFGFFWGGNFSRLDGMHFEVCKILR
jgi:hypothetical protein